MQRRILNCKSSLFLSQYQNITFCFSILKDIKTIHCSLHQFSIYLFYSTTDPSQISPLHPVASYSHIIQRIKAMSLGFKTTKFLISVTPHYPFYEQMNTHQKLHESSMISHIKAFTPSLLLFFPENHVFLSFVSEKFHLTI